MPLEICRWTSCDFGAINVTGYYALLEKSEGRAGDKGWAWTAQRQRATHRAELVGNSWPARVEQVATMARMSAASTGDGGGSATGHEARPAVMFPSTKRSSFSPWLSRAFGTHH